jgi:acylphosphatase
MPARRFFVEGRVQGVFFRASTAEQAHRLGITGHAINLADGRVEVLAWGEPAALATLGHWLAVGPPGARVDAVTEDAAPVDGSRPERFRTG